MANEEKSQDTRYCLSKVGEDATSRGIYNVYASDFRHEDPLSEFIQETKVQAPLPKVETPTKVIHKKATSQEELGKLKTIYCEKMRKERKANRIRWSLTFCGFSIFNFIGIMLYMGNFNIEDVLLTSLKDTCTALLLAVVLAGIYFLVNVSIFGWLIQKSIAADRELEPILKRIRELEKKTK